jgi:hypothetical protein
MTPQQTQDIHAAIAYLQTVLTLADTEPDSQPANHPVRAGRLVPGRKRGDHDHHMESETIRADRPVSW